MSVVFVGFSDFLFRKCKPVGKLREQCRERMYLAWLLPRLRSLCTQRILFPRPRWPRHASEFISEDPGPPTSPCHHRGAEGVGTAVGARPAREPHSAATAPVASPWRSAQTSARRASCAVGGSGASSCSDAGWEFWRRFRTGGVHVPRVEASLPALLVLSLVLRWRGVCLPDLVPGKGRSGQSAGDPWASPPAVGWVSVRCDPAWPSCCNIPAGWCTPVTFTSRMLFYRIGNACLFLEVLGL